MGDKFEDGRAQETLLSVQQVAKHFQVCTKTICRIIAKRDIPVERIGSKIRIRASYLPLFMKKQW